MEIFYRINAKKDGLLEMQLSLGKRFRCRPVAFVIYRFDFDSADFLAVYFRFIQFA